MTIHRVINFNAGPAGLPLPALERAQAELLDYAGTGMSIMEHSHRGKTYEAVHHEAIALLRELLAVPANYQVLLLQGGARQAFATVPMNLLPAGRSADYVITGGWARDAFDEAKYVGTVRAAGPDFRGRFTRVPLQSECAFDPSAAYAHITSNNTLVGTQYHEFPTTGDVSLVADMSSDFLWRPFDVSRFGLIYAGAQKNLGPSGVTIFLVRDDLLAGGRTDIPKIFRFAEHAKHDSMFNTPPTFAIYLMRNVLSWVRDLGGLTVIEARNRAKAKTLYGTLDALSSFYKCPVEVGSRSTMNVVFRLPDEALEAKLVAEAEANGMVGIKGHRSVGGIRVSMYNAVTPEQVETFAGFLRDFAARHG